MVISSALNYILNVVNAMLSQSVPLQLPGQVDKTRSSATQCWVLVLLVFHHTVYF